MQIQMKPVVSIYDLEDILHSEFGIKVDNLTEILFGDNYSNDCYKSYFYDEREVYEGKFWQNKEHIEIRNKLSDYLEAEFPNYNCVLVDITW